MVATCNIRGRHDWMSMVWTKMLRDMVVLNIHTSVVCSVELHIWLLSMVDCLLSTVFSLYYTLLRMIDRNAYFMSCD